MISRRTLLKGSVSLLAATALPFRYALASHDPMRFIAPGSVGTGGDQMTRYMARAVETALGRTVVVENRPGAGGMIGTEQVAKAAPDGNTILVTSANHFAMSWI